MLVEFAVLVFVVFQRSLRRNSLPLLDTPGPRSLIKPGLFDIIKHDKIEPWANIFDFLKNEPPWTQFGQLLCLMGSPWTPFLDFGIILEPF